MVKCEWKSNSVEEEEAPSKYCGHLCSPNHLSSYAAHLTHLSWYFSHPSAHPPPLPTTLPYISPSFCPQSVHPSASLLTHPSHIHLPIHPSMHSSFPPLLICSFTYFCQLHTAYQSTPLSCLSIYLCFHRPTSHPCTSFPSCHPPLNLSSGPSTHHSSVPPTHLATCLPICLLIDPLPRSVLRWAWHVAECSREDRLKRT